MIAVLTLAAALSGLKTGETRVLQPGRYRGGAIVRTENVVILGGPGVVIDAKGLAYGIKFDRCRHVTLSSVEVVNSLHFGIFATNCSFLTVLSCRTHDCRHSGILTG